MKLLAASILSADFTNFAQQIRSVEMGGADWIHCDVMDGKFVPNLTFGPIVVKAVKKTTNLPIDVHLMIEKPENLIEEFVKAGADYLTIHQEEVIHLHRVLERIRELGAKSGVAINPSTPINTLTNILEYADLILIMSVNPGFGGQKFIEGSQKKIKELYKRKNINITKIRPLIDVPNSKFDKYIVKNKIPLIPECCPDIGGEGFKIYKRKF